MSLLTVVRHGQASFFADDYDRLSAIGEEQARKLGEYWLARQVSFDRVYYGPAQRQIRTGEIIAEMYRKAGRKWPEPAVVAELNEFPADEIIGAFLPELTERYPYLGEWMAQLEDSADSKTRQNAYDRLLRDVAGRWLAGEVTSKEIPSWQDFCHRVENVVRGIVKDSPKSSRVATFTSAGPTSATVRVALRLSYESTLELTWSPRNASLTEFLFTQGRFSLASFNTTPHLADEALLTYR